MSSITQRSYWFMGILLAVVAWLHLGTVLVTVLFSVFALRKLQFSKYRAQGAICFVALVATVIYGFIFFIHEAVEALPRVMETAIPMIITYAGKHGFELPFTDIESLKTLVMSSLTEQFKQVGNFARVATLEFAYLIIGFVVAVSLHLNPRFERNEPAKAPMNLFKQFCFEVSDRFASFFRSFALVMGAQLLISAINTALTATFVFSVSLPHAWVILVVTFLCGLLPIIGNLISNTVIVSVAFTRSPEMALAALAFLVIIHKLEYFLNSKIIGDRIKNPVWLTLLALILGERLMGIPGMILAPVILNFLKVEASRLPAWGSSNTENENCRGEGEPTAASAMKGDRER